MSFALFSLRSRSNAAMPHDRLTIVELLFFFFCDGTVTNGWRLRWATTCDEVIFDRRRKSTEKYSLSLTARYSKMLFAVFCRRPLSTSSQENPRQW